MSERRDYTEQELLEGIVAQNAEILEDIYESNFRSVRKLVIKNKGKEVDAKDIFQETMVIIYRRLKEEEVALDCSLKTYIYSVARLLWLRELDSRKKRKIDFEECDQYIDIVDSVYQLVEVNDRLKLYHEEFELLGDECKKILRLFLNNISISEITKIMGYKSDQHTKNRRYRCKRLLIENIRNNPKYEELKNEKDDDDREIPRW